MNHAIVMGGSIGGMCAAAALAKNFDRVTVLERDAEPGTETRKGTPQSHHVHALLAGGKQAIEELLPGTFEALEKSGAHCVDPGRRWRWFQFGAWKPALTMGRDLWCQSRPLLEHVIRESLMQNPRVHLRFESTVAQPIHEDGLVRGVVLQNGEELRADLLVDTTGRGSRAATWLEEWGYGAVPIDTVEIDLAYVSGVFEFADGRELSRNLSIYHHGANRRSGVAMGIEGGRFVVSLSGYHGERAPTDLEGFRAWARGLLQPEIADILDDAKLVSSIKTFTIPRQTRKRYGDLRRLPQGLLILGDAMCAIDPTFAQGMSLVAMQSALLKNVRPGTATRPMQRRLAKLANDAFESTACEHHRMAETRGWRPRLLKLRQALMAEVFTAASRDPEIYRQFFEVMNFVAPPTSLLRPSFLWRLFRSRQPVTPLPTPKVAACPLPGASASLTQTGF